MGGSRMESPKISAALAVGHLFALDPKDQVGAA